MAKESLPSVPAHVCIIMDGNGRWAKKRLMPRTYGHGKGVETTRRAVEFFTRAGVKNLTLFAFSSENWSRPKDEVNSLMSLFLQSLEKYGDELQEQNIRIRFIGLRDSFPPELQAKIQQTEIRTESNQQMCLNIAANYGGKADIVSAARLLAERVARGEIQVSDIDTTEFAGGLSLAGTPDPDLFIRTGGEHRLSNFLLWQMAYTELYFCDTLWPDFDETEMQAALDHYARRERRFGKTGEQVGIAR